jgi:hypothetical protein
MCPGTGQAPWAVGTDRPDASVVRLPRREAPESVDARSKEVTLGSTELLLVVLIIVVLFGSTLLPKLARGIIQSRREFDRGRD